MSMTARFLPVTTNELEDVICGRSEAINLLFPDDKSDGQQEALDIDKSWHAIHYLLTGDPWDGPRPLCQAVLGGEPVGEDLGYGPARYLTPGEVAEVAATLQAVSPETLRERFGDGTSLSKADIYPDIWDRGPDTLDYVTTYFTQLVSFYRHAADSERAMLLFIV